MNVNELQVFEKLEDDEKGVQNVDTPGGSQKVTTKELAEAVTGSKDTIDMKSVAGLLNMNIGLNKLFEFLRNNKILNNDNCPYQRYCDLGYFRLIESKFTVNDETKISLKTVVFQKGVNFIRKLLIKEGYKENKGGKDEKRV